MSGLAMRPPGLSRTWLDQWFARTASWADPFATLGAGTATALLPDVLVTMLSEGIRRRFTGQRIDLSLRGRPMQATLVSLRVRRRGASFQSRIELADIDWDGHMFDALTITASGVRLIPSLATRLVADSIDIEGEVRVAALVGWLNTQGLQWALHVDNSGLIRAHHTRRRLVALVDGSVRNDVLRIEVKRAHWYGVGIPMALRTARSVALPPLPNNGRFRHATRNGDVVRFAIDFAALEGTIDLAQVRSAIAAGSRLIVW